MAYKGRHDDEDYLLWDAFDAWAAEGDNKRERGYLFGAFAHGWSDAVNGRGDFYRRMFDSTAQEAYFAGREAGRKELSATRKGGV